MSVLMHGTAVAHNGRGILFIGKSNSGKSSAALHFCALGGQLLADDAVIVKNIGGTVLMTCPDSIKQLLEVRSIGILKVMNCEGASLDYLVDMDHNEINRLPDAKTRAICGVAVPYLSGKSNTNLVNALFCLLNGGEIIPV